MKTKSILIGLLCVSVIGNMYLINKSRKENETTNQNEKITETQQLRDSITNLRIEKNELSYFDLKSNSEAQEYFFEKNIDNVQDAIEAALLETNIQKGQHPLIRFGSEKGVFLTNKFRILNHKWIICDFSDSSVWGEVLLKYDFDENKKVHFTVIDDLLYPKYK